MLRSPWPALAPFLGGSYHLARFGVAIKLDLAGGVWSAISSHETLETLWSLESEAMGVPHHSACLVPPGLAYSVSNIVRPHSSCLVRRPSSLELLDLILSRVSILGHWLE